MAADIMVADTGGYVAIYSWLGCCRRPRGQLFLSKYLQLVS